MQKYRNVSSTSQQIYDAFFNKLNLSIFKEGVHLSIHDSEELNGLDPEAVKQKIAEKLETGLEICFIPHDQMNHSPTYLPHFSNLWQALRIPAYDLNCDNFYEATIMHELVHALDKKILKKIFPGEVLPDSATVSIISDERALAEIETSKFEILILNTSSQGKYLPKLEELVATYDSKTVAEFFQSLAIADFQELNQIVGCDNLTEESAGLLLGVHLMSLGLVYFEGKQVSASDMIKFYKFVMNL